MARIFTTPSAERTAKTWMHDLALAADIITATQYKSGYTPYFTNNFRSCAKSIYDELTNREFKDIDSSIYYLDGSRVKATLDGSVSGHKKVNAETITKSIVYMAELLNLYWDDTVRTPYEIDEFKKTLLGAAVYKYGRCLSAIAGKGAKTTSAKTTSPRATGQPPKNNYKQTGPQSSNVRDLKGTPGQKVVANTSLIYKIIGDNPQSKNIPNVFIKPLDSNGAVGNTNKIFISSGNGYTDCTCYFDDPNDATDFLNKIITNNRVPANITNLRVVKGKADPNGYFLVGTEFGDCAIAAKKLNEALAESTENAEIAKSDWDKATESYTKKDLDELHTWMRRG